MMLTEEMEGQLRDLPATQRPAVLATHSGEHPWCSLVAFAATPVTTHLAGLSHS